jgi:hypothetical protein
MLLGIFIFIEYHKNDQIFKFEDTKAIGAGIAYMSRTPEYTTSFKRGSCCSIFSFLCSVLLTIVCLFLFFLFAVVFSVLQFMASDNRFGIFKLENLIIFVIFYENKYTKQHPNCDDFVPEKLNQVIRCLWNIVYFTCDFNMAD